MKQENDAAPANLESILHSKVEIKEEFWYEDCTLQLPDTTLQDLLKQNVSQLPALQSNTPNTLSALVESPQLSFRTDKKRNEALSTHHKKSPVSSRPHPSSTVQKPLPFLFVSSNDPDAALCSQELPFLLSPPLQKPSRSPPGSKPARKRYDHNELRHCLYCDFKTIHRTTLSSHIVRKHQGKRFECNYCKKRFPTNSRLREHLKWHQLPGTIQTYFCSNCNFTAHHHNTLNSHILTKHSGLKFKCDLCKKIFSRKGYLKQHMKTHIKDPQMCCGRWFRNSAMLDQHISRMHAAKTLFCNFPGCKKSYIQFLALEKHKAKHITDNIPPERKVMSFLTKHNSSTHTKKVKGVPKVHSKRSRNCRKVLPKMPILVQSINTENTKVYICPHCSHSATTRSGVTVHVARHHRSYKFECDYCKKLFGVKQDLWRHITCTHSVTPLNCEICGRQYKHVDSLKGHHMVKHAGIPFQGKTLTCRGRTLSDKSMATIAKTNVKLPISTAKSFRQKQETLIDSTKMNPIVLLTRLTLSPKQSKQLEYLNVKNSLPPAADFECYSAFTEKEIPEKNLVQISAALSDIEAALETMTSVTVKQDTEVPTTSCEMKQKDTVEQQTAATTTTSSQMARTDDMFAVVQERVCPPNAIIKEEFFVEDTLGPIGNNLEKPQEEPSQAVSTHNEKRLLSSTSSQEKTVSKVHSVPCQRNQNLKRSSYKSASVNFATGFWCRRRYWVSTLKKNTLSTVSIDSKSTM